MIEIEIIDSVDARISRSQAETITPCLQYTSHYWKQGRFRKERVQYQANCFTLKEHDYWYFRTGLIPRVQKYLNDRKITYKIIHDDGEYEHQYNAPHLHGITFRDDQLQLIHNALAKKRGVIQAPTGTGKTILQLGIISCFPKCKTLILAHTKALVQQTFEELIKFGFTSVQRIDGNSKTRVPSAKVVVSTMQSFVKVDLRTYSDYFDIVIIDEAHHVSSESGVYAEILSFLLAPLRFGFTATVPTKLESIYALEGLIGPMIGKQTIQDAADLDILAKPRVKLLKSRYNPAWEEIRHYFDKHKKDRVTKEVIEIIPGVYTTAIVNNRQRNRLIISTAKEYIDSGKSVLILVTQIEHGDNLVDIAENIFGMDIFFVRGSTESKAREEVKKLLIEKKAKCVIATAVWREGINIPTLDVVINACGGKSEIMTLQAIGRGLRKTKDKEEVIIVDFFDESHNFLVKHFGKRVTLYMENGWL